MKKDIENIEQLLDETNRRYIVNGRVVELTRMETIVLKELINNKDIVITYDMLEVAAYGTITGACNGVRAAVSRLRGKLKGVLEIKTKYQIGYYIN